MKITELTSFAEQRRLYPLIEQLNPGMSKPEFEKRLKVMRKNGYRCVAAVEKGKILAAAGFWIGTRFWCGPYMEADNVVVDKSVRGKGIGKKLMEWLENEGRRCKCEMSWLLCYTSQHASHRFYSRENYIIKGFVFAKDMKGK